ncbi:MAG: type II toxin-antitoxin system HigB family toxin [Lentisphaerae bacterium]|nr:type II toxin-antitoxin system HigB family toxin [Lentisphaerota bacterium]
MILAAKGRLEKYVKNHSSVRKAVEGWISDVEISNWKTPHDIRKRYSSASFLPKNNVVFNLKGNNYRLIVVVAYAMGVVTVKWIGTHAEYDKLN